MNSVSNSTEMPPRNTNYHPMAKTITIPICLLSDENSKKKFKNTKSKSVTKFNTVQSIH